MEWSRYRTIGLDLVIVGVLVLLLSLGFALESVCSPGGVCTTVVDWPTLSPSMALIAAGAGISFLSRRLPKSWK